MAKHFADLSGELFQVKRFLNEPVAAALKDRRCPPVNTVSAGKQYFCFGVQLSQLVECLFAAGVGHNQIKDDQIDLIRGGFVDSNTLFAGGGNLDAIAELHEHLLSNFADHRFVIDEQNRL